MQFASSPKGRYLLAFNSSRIHLFNVYESHGIQVKREFKIVRRPLAVCVTDDAELLAVLSSDMQVNLYDLTQSPPQRKPALVLDNTPRTIALSTCGSVLAVAYDDGIEVTSLGSGTNLARRAVKCDGVDSLAFSYDGTQLIGTTSQSSSSPSTVILTAPYFDPATAMIEDNLHAMWTTSILFPNTSHDCSHTVLLQNGAKEEATWAFTYDRSFESFRAIRIDDLRNGTTYFTGPEPKASSQAKLLPSTLPAASCYGQAAAAAFHGKDVWMYGVPEDLNAVPEPALSGIDSGPLSPGSGRNGGSSLSRNGSSRSRDVPQEGQRVPQWQLLVDKLRNNFVTGHHIFELPGLNNLTWVADYGSHSFQERLVLTARGLTSTRLATDEENIDFKDGGRVVLLDFDYSTVSGKQRDVTMELGSDDAEALEEEQRSLETEVAIARRRTVAQRKKGSTALLRAVTTAGQTIGATVPGHGEANNDDDGDDPLVPRTMGRNPAETRLEDIEQGTEEEEGISIDEMEALDAPYAHASPRSGTTLRRAATAAAVNRTMNPRTADGRRIEFRRADGRREHPHESDADNWVPPPPPYQKEDPGDAPAFLRGGRIVAPLASPVIPVPAANSQTNAEPDQTGGVVDALGLQRRTSRQRTASDSTTYSTRPRTEELARQRSSSLVFPDIPTEPSFDFSFINNASDLDLRLNTALTTATGGVPLCDMGSSLSSVPPHSASDIPLPSNQGENEIRPQSRQILNAQTWPRTQQADEAAASSSPLPGAPTAGPNVPQSAPATGVSMDQISSSALPPAPKPDQIQRLNERMSTVGHPARLSGAVPTQWAVANSSQRTRNESWPLAYQPPAQTQDSSTGSPIIGENEERPLIISTPGGVAGSFDNPEKPTASQPTDTPILAPVPRRPRQNIPFNSRQQSIRRRPLYSPSAIQNYNLENQRARNLPSWIQSPTGPTSSSRGSLNRNPSRAERSAAKNMQDARKRGWKPHSKKQKNSQSSGTADRGIEPSTGEWMDVSPVATSKDKKCVVM